MRRFPCICHALSRRFRHTLTLRALACLSLAVWLSACSNLEFPWVYRLNIDQGNIITQDMVNQLKPGMTRDQVKFVMGSPLIVDPFHADRWDYIYTLRKADGKRTREQLTVLFKDDQLASLSGDFLPAAAQTAPATTPAPDTATPTN